MGYRDYNVKILLYTGYIPITRAPNYTYTHERERISNKSSFEGGSNIYNNMRELKRKQPLRFWLTILIVILAVILTIMTGLK